MGGYVIINKGDILQNNYISSADFKKGDDIFDIKNKTIFLKIDVEGHEIHVLAGLNNLLKNNNIIIQVEILPGKYKSVKRIFDNLKFDEIEKISNDYYFMRMI